MSFEERTQKIRELTDSIIMYQAKIQILQQSRKTLLKEISDVRKKIADMKNLRTRLIQAGMSHE